jgi:hypothetical protein
MGVETRACPLRQLQETHGGGGGASVSTARVGCELPASEDVTPEQHASLPASVAVTAITDLLFGYPSFFGHRVIPKSSAKIKPA